MHKNVKIANLPSDLFRRLTCRTCCLSFVKVQKLVSHLVWIFVKDFWEICIVFEYFNFKIEARHNDTTDCSACGYNASSHEDYEAHLEKHQEVAEKPYFCAHCDLRFSMRKVIFSFPKLSIIMWSKFLDFWPISIYVEMGSTSSKALELCSVCLLKLW